MTPLRNQARRWGKRQNGQTTQSYDLIPPQRRGGDIKAPERKARADLMAAARLDGISGQRWKVETVNSVIKRKFGDTIRSRSRRLQFREPLFKALVYNFHVWPVFTFHMFATEQF